MEKFETVLVDRHEGVAVVTMNRPEAFNACSQQLGEELVQAIEAVNADNSIRVGVLTGAGQAFCAGADLKDMGFLADPESMTAIKNIVGGVVGGLNKAPKPWISAVNGACVGVAGGYAMSCALSVMAEEAYILVPFTRLAVVPDGGVTWQLARHLGPKRAYSIIANSEKLSASKCLELGLCNQVVPGDQLMDVVLSMAQDLAEKSSCSLGYSQQLVNEAMETDLHTMIGQELKLQETCIRSDEFRENAAKLIKKS